MSTFLGIVRLGPGAVQIHPSVLPDQPRVGPVRVWTGPGAVLLHRQRVNTPEDRFEAQPTPLWGGAGAILFHGRLDDRAGLCEQLGADLSESVADSALVALAFEKWGADAPAQLIGDFAIAAWDGRSRRAVLCADRSGMHPLYYYNSNGLLVFGTVLPALLSVPGVPCAIEERVVADLLFKNTRDTTLSFFRGISRVLRGTSVTLSESGEKLSQYWYPAAKSPLILRSDEEYVEAAREILDKAVKCRLRSLVPVPVQGSGGLDSSCIMVSVLGQTNAPSIPVFTAVPGNGVPLVPRAGKYPSERSRVLAMQATFPRLSPRFVEPADRPDAEFAPERIFEEAAVPLVSVLPSGWVDMTFRRMRDEGATSCLAGHVGNSTLTWDGRASVYSLFRQGRWLKMAFEAAALAGYHPARTVRSILSTALRPHVPPALLESRWRTRVSLHPKAELELKMIDRLRDAGERRYTRHRDGTGYRLQMLTVNRALSGEYTAWTQARHGIETRDPLDDTRLIDFCMSIPEDQFLHRGQTRWLARRLLRVAGVPPEITDNTDRGAWCPEWFTQLEKRLPGFKGEIARLRESPAASRLIDLDKLSSVVADWPGTPDGVGPLRPELETMFARALHVGAFIRWAEARNSADSAAAYKYPSLAITSP